MELWQLIILVPCGLFMVPVVAIMVTDITRRIKYLAGGNWWKGGTMSELLASLDEEDVFP